MSTTDLYDGESSPIGILDSMAQMLGANVNNMFALALCLIYMLVGLASCIYRKKPSWYVVAPLTGAIFAGYLTSQELTERGSDGSRVFIALACLGAGIGCLMAILVVRTPQMFGRGGYTAHVGAPMLIGVNTLTAALWLALGTTLLQNAMSGHSSGLIEACHWSTLIGAGLTGLFAFVQAGYTPPSPRYI
jgi:hypothetical protein